MQKIKNKAREAPFPFMKLVGPLQTKFKPVHYVCFSIFKPGILKPFAPREPFN